MDRIEEYESRIIEALGREVPNIVVYRWILARWRRDAYHLLEVGWNPRNKEKIIDTLSKDKERFLRGIEIERQEGRKAYERYRRTGERSDLLEALSHWGRAGFYTRYLRVIDYLTEWWRAEYAREVGLEYVGIDADTGRQIFWDTRKEVYVEVDERGRVTHESEEIQLDETISVETDSGHDAPLTCEVTARTKLKKVSRKALEAIRDGMQTQLDRWLKTQPYYPSPPAELKRKAPFSSIASTFNPLKTGVEVRLRVMPETPEYPRALTITERTSRLYPEWRRIPYTYTDALVADLEKSRLIGRVFVPPERAVVSTSPERKEEIREEKKRIRELGL